MGWRLPKLPQASLERRSIRHQLFRRKPQKRVRTADNVSDLKKSPGSSIAIGKPTKESSTNRVKTMTNSNCETKSSKPSVKAWMRRVLRKENPTSKPDRGSSLFRRRGRTRKARTDVNEGESSPTNSRAPTDESSSQYSPSRTDEISRQELLNVPMDESYRVHNQNSMENAGRAHTLPLTPRSSDTTTREERAHDDDSQKSYFEKSEIITKLFPMGYPTSKAPSESDSGRDVTRDNEEAKNGHIDGPIERCCQDLNESPFPRSEVVRSLFPMGHPDETKCNSDHEETDSTSPTTADEDCDQFIGLVITFDPTWDLLTQGPDEAGHSATMVKARLRKFHEIENYDDSILGKFAEENSSEEDSNDLLAEVNLSFGIESPTFPPGSTFQEGMAEGKSPNNSFELGYHFDHRRFPLVHTSEVEICFYPDEDSIEGGEEFVLTKSCDTASRATKNNPKFQQAFDFVFRSQESRGNVHFDDSDSNDCSVSGEIFLDESLECVDSDNCNAQSSIDPKIHSLPLITSPQHMLSPHNLFLFTDKDDDESVQKTECESSPLSSTEIIPKHGRIKPLCIPQLRSSHVSLATPFSSNPKARRRSRTLRL